MEGVSIICHSERVTIATARFVIDNPITIIKEIPSKRDEIYPIW
jgi:hypothetical protein